MFATNWFSASSPARAALGLAPLMAMGCLALVWLLPRRPPAGDHAPA